MNMPKALKGKRTILLNSFITLLLAILKWQGVDLPEEVVGPFIATANIAMRFVTDGPVNEQQRGV